MAVDIFGVVQIGGSIDTIAEAESFIKQARAFGADDETKLANGFLSIELVGTPEPVTAVDGTTQAVIPLTVYEGV